jgi:hypothetical protein
MPGSKGVGIKVAMGLYIAPFHPTAYLPIVLETPASLYNP